MKAIISRNERRKRLLLPNSILITGIILFFLPFFNFMQIFYQLKMEGNAIIFFLRSLNIFEMLLLLSPFIISIGLLRVKKWAWWGLLVYFSILVVYDLYILLLSTSAFNFGALVRTFLGIVTLFFFVRKDISAPYFKMYPRGWRGEKRNPIELGVFLDGKEFKTKDVSSSGVYIDWKNCDISLGEEVEFSFKNENGSTPKIRKAGVVRIDEIGVGLAFRK